MNVVLFNELLNLLDDNVYNNSDIDILNGTRIVSRSIDNRNFESNQYNNFLRIKYPIIELANKSINDCSICLEKIEDCDKIYVLMCNHIFHVECLNKWNKNTCPYCRSEIS
jgi:hypothetical protein